MESPCRSTSDQDMDQDECLAGNAGGRSAYGARRSRASRPDTHQRHRSRGISAEKKGALGATSDGARAARSTESPRPLGAPGPAMPGGPQREPPTAEPPDPASATFFSYSFVNSQNCCSSQLICVFLSWHPGHVNWGKMSVMKCTCPPCSIIASCPDLVIWSCFPYPP